MASSLRLRLAKQSAEALIQKLQIPCLPIDPFLIAEKHDIAIQAKPNTAIGVSGMLLRHGEAFGIMYATNISSEGFQRFSVAHELGHYFLEGHIDHVFKDGDVHESQAGFTSGDIHELEADHFAAGLLMPSHLFLDEQAQHEAGLHAIEELSRACRTSLTATAIAYAESTEDAVAVVLSTGPLVDFCCMSELMRSKGNFNWPRKGTPVPRNTATAELNAHADRVATADRETREADAVAWFGGDRSLPCVEEVAGLGSYGRTLTVLSCPTLEDEVDDEEDDASEESMLDHWAHRF